MTNQEKIIVVTGGARGIGAAICRQLHTAGYSVYSLDLNPPMPGVNHRQVDLGSPLAVKQEIAWWENQASKNIMGFVNNAGVFGISEDKQQREQDLQRMLQINQLTPLLLSEFFSHQVDIRIVNVASIAGLLGGFNPMYAMTKASLITLAQCLALQGVAACSIAPPLVEDTLMYKLVPQHVKERYRAALGDAGFTTSTKVADLVYRLLTGDSFDAGSCYDMNLKQLVVPSVLRPN